jgi:lysozyme family protein
VFSNAVSIQRLQVGADGIVGPKTVAAVNAHGKPLLLLKAFSLIRGNFYISLAEKTPSQKQFIPSWLSRISLP